MLIGNGVPIKIVGFLCCAGEGDSKVGFYYVMAPGALQIRTVAISRTAGIVSTSYRCMQQFLR
jgi:NitT/TauT family transport system substrate-binding protein